MASESSSDAESQPLLVNASPSAPLFGRRSTIAGILLTLTVLGTVLLINNTTAANDVGEGDDQTRLSLKFRTNVCSMTIIHISLRTCAVITISVPAMNLVGVLTVVLTILGAIPFAVRCVQKARGRYVLSCISTRLR